MSTVGSAFYAAVNLKEQSNVLNFAMKHPSKEGNLARKAYFRSMIITLAIIFLIMIPMCVYTVLKMTNEIGDTKLPVGATQQVRGHIDMYKDSFWYTDSSKKYEFDLNRYLDGNTYEKGEIINIYMDDNNNVIAIGHQNQNEGVLEVILMYVVPIVLLIIHAFVGKKTYCKWWMLYYKWYQVEIEPYRFASDFENICGNKKYYDVTVK